MTFQPQGEKQELLLLSAHSLKVEAETTALLVLRSVVSRALVLWQGAVTHPAKGVSEQTATKARGRRTGTRGAAPEPRDKQDECGQKLSLPRLLAGCYGAGWGPRQSHGGRMQVN